MAVSAYSKPGILNSPWSEDLKESTVTAVMAKMPRKARHISVMAFGSATASTGPTTVPSAAVRAGTATTNRAFSYRPSFDARVYDTGRDDEIGELTEAFNAMADSIQKTEQQHAFSSRLYTTWVKRSLSPMTMMGSSGIVRTRTAWGWGCILCGPSWSSTGRKSQPPAKTA